MAIIKGTAKNDNKKGTNSSDSISGFAGDDVISGGTGDDFIDGGEGQDTAVFKGNRSDYDVKLQNANEDLINERDAAQAMLDEQLAGLEQVQAEFDAAQVGLDEAQATVDEAQTALDYAQTIVDKSTKPTTKQLAALEQAQIGFDDVISAFEAAQADFESMQANVDEMTTFVDEAQAALDEAGDSSIVIVLGNSFTVTLSNVENIQFTDGTFTIDQLVNTPVDPVLPEAPVIDKVTGDNVIEPHELEDTITINGTAEAGTLVELLSGEFSDEVSTNEDGTWSYEIDPSDFDLFNLDDSGRVSIEAVAVNSDGDVSAPSVIDALVINSTRWNVGNDSKNTLSGKNLYGGDGNDTLKGNADNGLIIGGAGKDSISGGTGNDTFIFLDESDSGTAKTTRDVIKDFKSGQDLIDLSHFVKDDVSGLVFIGKNNFGNTGDGIAQVRFSAGILSVDSNGDNKADFAVELTGVKVLVESDLILA